jgi:hypothetical protein
LKEKVAVPVWKIENAAVGIRHADHMAYSIRKRMAQISPTSGGRSVGIVRSRTQATEVVMGLKIKKRKSSNRFCSVTLFVL